MAGRIAYFFAPISAALPLVQRRQGGGAGGIGATRSPLLASVPTVAEQGYPGFDYTLWVGLWGPANMPADLAAKINKDVLAALASPEVRERLTKLGTVPGGMTIPEFTAFVRKEVDETQKILQAAGIKPQ